jgi:hypothetical protein
MENYYTCILNSVHKVFDKIRFQLQKKENEIYQKVLKTKNEQTTRITKTLEELTEFLHEGKSL